jgi:hypothetical protein
MQPMRAYRTLIIIGILLPSILNAQPYKHAAGVRAGYSSGITYKGFFLHSMNAVELDFYYNNHGLNLSALYVLHVEPFRSERWLLHFGGGVFGGNWDGDPSVGLVAAGGIEYNIRDIPLNFGLDWRPMLNVYKEFAYDFLDFGISIRYRFSL